MSFWTWLARAFQWKVDSDLPFASPLAEGGRSTNHVPGAGSEPDIVGDVPHMPAEVRPAPAPAAPPKPDPRALTGVTAEDIDVATRTLWGEARGESDAGRIAVAWVIRNRVEHARDGMRRVQFGGGTLAGACKQPWQFSCWNAGDPNRVRMLALPATDPLYRALRTIVEAVVAGTAPDPTNHADHYCTRAIAPVTAWAKGRKPVAASGNHLFYRLI
jgi:spore germination cell wall hydrolase CwlJ-like protein